MLPDEQHLQGIKGFLSPVEGRCLYELALAASQTGPCLEIGSYCGKSAVYLGKACQINQAILFTVDHHRGSEEQQPGELWFDPQLYNMQTGSVDTLPGLRHTLAAFDLEDTVVPLVCHSAIAARQWATPLSLIFIDGGHAPATVQTDYEVWVSHLRPGGYLVFHDIYLNPDQGGQAPREVYEQAAASGLFSVQPVVDTLGILKRIFPLNKITH